MSAVVVVALPAADDPIWAASSEKAPHLTVLFFGENVAAGDIGWLKGVVKQAADKMTPFTATVTSREPLGDDGADVVMVDPGQQMVDARSQMLSDHTVEVMFNAVEQYPKWTPHVTLGYPDTPANGEPSDTIRFDRLSVWDGDYEGEEYPMGAGSWVPYGMVASAGIAAPLVELEDAKGRKRVRVCLPLSDRDAATLVVGNIVGRELSLPLLDLGNAEDFTPEKQERLMDVVAGLAASRNANIPADLGVEYGTTGSELWTRPTVEGYNALRSRLIAELAQNTLPFDRVLPDPVISFATLTGEFPEYLRDLTPQRVFFDRLAVEVGDDTFEFPFGMLSSGAVLAAGTPGLIIDGDAMSSLSDTIETPEVSSSPGAGEGARFRIPLLVPEGVPTGDGRIFKPMSLRTRDLPLPLLWQIKTSDGHDGSVVVGRIDTIERVDTGLGNAFGVFDTGPYGREAERMVRQKFLRGVSADLDQFEAVAEEAQTRCSTATTTQSGKTIKAADDPVSKARVMGVTVVAKPAFQECSIELIEDDDIEQEEPLVADGIYMDRLTAIGRRGADRVRDGRIPHPRRAPGVVVRQPDAPPARLR